MANQRATIIVDVVPSSTQGNFAPVAREAKTLERSLDEVARKLDEKIVRPLKNDPTAQMQRGVDQLNSRLRGLANPFSAMATGAANAQRNVSGLQSTMDRLGGTANRLGGAFGNAAGGLTQLARGLAMFGGGDVAVMMQRMLQFTAIADVGRGLGQLGGGVRGMLSSGGGAAGRAAMQAGGQGLGIWGTAGTVAGVQAAPTVLGTIAGRVGSAWRSTADIRGIASARFAGARYAAGAATRAAGLPLAAAFSAYELGEGIARGGDFSNSLTYRYMPDWMAEGIAGGLGMTDGSGVERAQGRLTASRQAMLMRHRRDTMAAEDISLRDPLFALGLQNRGTSSAYGADIMAQREMTQASIRERQRAVRRTELEYQAARGEAPGATSIERMRGRSARLEIFGQLNDAATASPQAIGARMQAQQRVEFLTSEVSGAQRAYDAAGSDQERLVLHERLLSLQQQHAAAVQQEIAANNAVAQSLAQQVQLREQALRAEHARARAAADAHRDETRGMGRQLATASVEDRQRLLRISRQQGPLSQEDEQFASGFGAFDQIIQRQRDARAAASPDIQEILRRTGRAARQGELDAAEQQAGAAAAQAGRQADDAARGVAAGMEASMPALERTLDDMVQRQVRQLDLVIANRTNEAIIRALQQLQAGNEPNAAGA